MEILFMLYLSHNGPTYDYYPVIAFYEAEVCYDAAEALNESLPAYHAMCLKESHITQPDGTTRPIARPEGLTDDQA